jgi:hypothetical protein
VNCAEVAGRALLIPGRAALLDATERAELEAHVRACPACARRRAVVVAGLDGGPAAYDTLFALAANAHALRLEVPGFAEADEVEAGEKVVSLSARRARWVAPAVATLVALAAAVLVYVRVPQPATDVTWRGQETSISVHLRLVRDGARLLVPEMPAQGDTYEVSGVASPNAELRGWAARATGPAESLGAARAGADGAFTLPVGWTVDAPGELWLIVSGGPSRPERGAAGWTCDGRPCALQRLVIP